ncbi:unnamed protein product [Allacma fusca]|uniref:RHD domain-containing protein n=1 Tax=Allacma fusca TaxID=39272 RepID=A0A8J2JT00_9HEXA|nr:unnamed protein product [Allacma fusca]
MRSPRASPTSANSPQGQTGATTTPSPVPPKRPRFNFSAPAPSKPTGLKLRNQNGVQMRGGSVGKRLPPGTTPTLTSPLAPVSRDGRVHLQILAQPEVQHRARYQTEGSRGAIKDRKCNGFPTVKLFGYDKPATLQIFIGTDQGKVTPHMFYQACKVTGKSSTPCIEKKTEGTVLIEIEFEPSKEMVISCDCVGILKERNVDVEQRFPFHHASATQSRKKSTKCRMIFRTTIINSLGQEETLQAASLPILCSQPPGQPEICKQSLAECSVAGGKELFIIGKNFLKDTKVMWQEENNQGDVVWEAKSIPLKDYLQQTHLICIIPSYKDESVNINVDCKISVWSGGKLSEPHRFTYLPNISAATMGHASSISSTSICDSPTQQSVLMQHSVGQSLTNYEMKVSPAGSDCQQVISMDLKPVIQGMSPEPMVSSSFVSSPSGMSSGCHVSPMSSMDSPILTNQMCSPEQSLNEVIPSCTSIGQIQPITFESTIMANTQPTYSAAAEELKTLLEQTTQSSPQYEEVAISMSEMDPLMSTAQMPQLMSSSSASLMSALVNENSQHQMLPMVQGTTVVGTSNTTPMEGIVGSQMTPIPISMNNDTTQQMIQTAREGQQQPGNSVVFINGELQGPIANALTQMSDNELINYINPSCFDQGSF